MKKVRQTRSGRGIRAGRATVYRHRRRNHLQLAVPVHRLSQQQKAGERERWRRKESIETSASRCLKAREVLALQDQPSCRLSLGRLRAATNPDRSHVLRAVPFQARLHHRSWPALNSTSPPP
jgi:hypothetical protein